MTETATEATVDTTAPATEEKEGSETRVGPMHEAFAAYIKENKGIEISPEQVFAVTSTRVAFRKSDAYLVGVKEAKEKARAEAEAAKAEAAAAKKAEREQAAAKKAEEKAAKEAAAAEAKAAKEAEAAAKAEAGEDASVAGAEAAKEKKSGKGKTAPTAKTESPF